MYAITGGHLGIRFFVGDAVALVLVLAGFLVFQLSAEARKGAARLTHIAVRVRVPFSLDLSGGARLTRYRLRRQTTKALKTTTNGPNAQRSETRVSVGVSAS